LKELPFVQENLFPPFQYSVSNALCSGVLSFVPYVLYVAIHVFAVKMFSYFPGRVI
jgi:hypothetical protein